MRWGVFLGSVFCFSCAAAQSPEPKPSAPGTQLETQIQPSPTASEAAENTQAKEGKPSLLEQPVCGPDSPECERVQRALALSEQGDTVTAHLQLKQLLDEFPRSVAVRLAGARILTQEESLSYGAGGSGAEQAVSLLREVLEEESLSAQLTETQRAQSELELGRCLLALAQLEEARTRLEPLVSRYPRDAEVQAAWGIALLAGGDVRGSLAPLTRAAELDPRRLERHLVLGTARFLAGDTQGAERAYRAALALHGSFAQTHGDLGALLLVEGRVEEARAHLEQAVRLDPKRAPFFSNLAYAELLVGDLQSAEEAVRRALLLDSKLASAWLNQGLISAQRRDFEKARAFFEKAQELDPDDPRPRQNLQDLKEWEEELKRQARE